MAFFVSRSASPGAAAPDSRTLNRVREVMSAFGNAVSAMKIFPGHHASVRGRLDEFARRLAAFLAERGRLDLRIEEHEFTFDGIPVYHDPASAKGLPFTFHKDGCRAVAFFDGVTREEVVDFLDLIRRESLKPADEGDVVNALWERDLPNIQFEAPDDFIANRILEERSESLAKAGWTVGPEELAARSIRGVDPASLHSGKIELQGDDLEAVRQSRDGAGTASAPEAGEPSGPGEDSPAAERDAKPADADDERPEPPPAAGAGTGSSPASAILAGAAERVLAARPPDFAGERLDPAALTMKDADLAAMESLVHSSRMFSGEEEFLDLMVEILFLETERDGLLETLKSLALHRDDRIVNGDFASAVMLAGKIRALRAHLEAEDPAKAAELGRFLAEPPAPEILETARTLVLEGEGGEPEALAAWLRTVGEPALPLAADIAEAVQVPRLRAAIVELFRATGEADPARLARLIEVRRPFVTREIIRLLAGHRDPRALSFLSAAVSFESAALRLETVRALAPVVHPQADRLLLAFIPDPDAAVRTEAAKCLRRPLDPIRIRGLLRAVSQKAFRKADPEEQAAFLLLIGRSGRAEALGFLKRTLRRRSLRPGSRTTGLRVAAARALGECPLPEAEAALRSGARARNARVREASAEALARRAAAAAGEAAP